MLFRSLVSELIPDRSRALRRRLILLEDIVKQVFPRNRQKSAEKARLILISDTHGNVDTIIDILGREGKKSDAVFIFRRRPCRFFKLYNDFTIRKRADGMYALRRVRRSSEVS